MYGLDQDIKKNPYLWVFVDKICNQ